MHNVEIEEDIVALFAQVHFVPTFFFIDPWGYKGLSLQLINAIIKDWGCECIFFFNYNRINPGLHNPFVKERMNAIFGKERADQLREQLKPLSPQARELTIAEAIMQAFQEQGKRYVLPFRFKKTQGARTSHHLIFVTKNVRGYEIMKDIMAGESSHADQGVASFEYSPATIYQPTLFELSRPLDELADMLLDEFAGWTLPVIEVYRRHHIGRPYILRNYKSILKQLEEQSKIVIDPSANRRRKGTLGDQARITFPPKG